MSGNYDEISQGGGGSPGRRRSTDDEENTNNGGSTSGGGRGPRFDDDDGSSSSGDATTGGDLLDRYDDDVDPNAGDTTPNFETDTGGSTSGGGRGPRFDDGGSSSSGSSSSSSSSSGDAPSLDDLAESYSENVAEPTAEAVGDATPAARAEEAVLGTNRTEQFVEGATETIVQAGNIPGALSGGRDLAETFARARRRSTDPVTIGGVPTGVTVPDLEGQRQNSKALASYAAAAAGAAADRPFRTAGSAFGGVVGGAVAGRKATQVARRTPSDTVEEFFADRRATTTGRQRPRSDGDTSSTTIDASDIESRQPEPDQGPSAFPDPQGRFQGGAGFNRNNPTRGDVDSPADVDPSGSGDGFGYRSVASEVQTAQRNPGVDSPTSPDLRSTVDFSDTAPGPSSTSSAFGAGGVSAGGFGSSSSDTEGDTSQSGGSTGSAVGGTSPLGELDATNDPSGVAPDTIATDGEDVFATTRTRSDTTGATDTVGGVDTANDPSGVAPGNQDTGTDVFGDTGTDVFSDSGAGTDTGLGSGTDTGTDTGVGPGQDQPPVTDTPPVTGTVPVTDTPGLTDTTTPTPTRTPTPPGDLDGRTGLTPRRPTFDLGGSSRPDSSAATSSSAEDVFGTGFADAAELFGREDDEEEEETLGFGDTNGDDDVFPNGGFF